MIGVALILIPHAHNPYLLAIPIGFMGFSVGMVDSSMMPHLGYLIDLRHAGVYGSVYAIGDLSLCIAYAVGPLLAGPFVKAGWLVCYQNSRRPS